MATYIKILAQAVESVGVWDCEFCAGMLQQN
jgi:hypothetical protein